MKSHQYASKRHLTNICCLVVSLAFIKIIFAAYVMAGGELFEFTAEKELSPKAAIIAQESRQRYMQTLESNSPESIQKNSQNSLVAQNKDVSGEVENTVPMSSATVSFLPKGQKNDKTDGNVQNVANNTEIKPALVAESSTPVPVIPNPVQKSAPYVELSDRVSSDAVLARASAVTANTARAQLRNHLLKNAIAENQKNSPQIFTEMEAERPSAVSQVAEVKKQNPKGKEKSSFFNFVGTANAAEEAYVRPDENTSVVIPPPTVAPYASPESLEYKQSELNRKEEELLVLQQQMNSRMEELNAIEGRIGNMVQGANTMQSDQLKHLIDTYTSMKAKKAAEALVSLDEEIAVRILNGMKGKQSGEIFSYMDSVQAARLSEAMSNLRM